MKDIIDRIKKKLKELGDRILKLEGFILAKTQFNLLEQIDQRLLRDQLGAMRQYAAILDQRLARMVAAHNRAEAKRIEDEERLAAKEAEAKATAKKATAQKKADPAPKTDTEKNAAPPADEPAPKTDTPSLSNPPASATDEASGS